MADNTEELVKLSRDGDKSALEALLQKIQNPIYRIAMKTLYLPQDAEDATQEILIKVITKLDGFRSESSFSTWAFTIAVNHLKNKQQNQKNHWFTFQRCENQILKELPDQATVIHFAAEQKLVVEEMRIACMHGLLQCLDKDHRLAYILGVSLELTGPEASEILEITPAAFRKRLSRARGMLRDFLSSHCDLFDENNNCHCSSQAMLAVEQGRINPSKLHYVTRQLSEDKIDDIKAHLNSFDAMQRDAVLMRMNQAYEAPGKFISGINSLLETAGVERH